MINFFKSQCRNIPWGKYDDIKNRKRSCEFRYVLFNENPMHRQSNNFFRSQSVTNANYKFSHQVIQTARKSQSGHTFYLRIDPGNIA